MSFGLIALLLASGAAAGIFGAILGLGGGIFVVPILVLAAGAPMHSAIATSLLCVIATSSGAASRNIANGLANVRLGLSLELWTVMGAIVGGTVAGVLRGPTLMVIFAVAMLLVSALMLKKPDESDVFVDDEGAGERLFEQRLEGSYFDPSLGRTLNYQPSRIPLSMGVSSLAGVLSGLLGIGGGILKVPALVHLSGVPMKAAAATSNFMIGVTGAASALIYYGRGDFSALIAAPTILGVYAGSRIGATLAGRIPAAHTRRLFALVLVLIAIQMLLKATGRWIS